MPLTHNRVLMSKRRQLFFSYVRETILIPTDQLVHVVRSSGQWSARFRAAALRNLISKTPLEVTGGAPFLERRRATRKHYQV